VTAYDYPSAQVAQEAGVDLVLVGDSAAMTVLGYPTTVPVSVDEMIMLASAVRRGLRTPLLVGDLPFGSYEASDEQAVGTAQRFVKEAGCDAVKLEGGGSSVAGAGEATDGQVLVFHDLLGIHEGISPRFAKRYAELKAQMVAAVAEYAGEVRARRFPGEEHVYSIDPAELERFEALLEAAS